MSTKSANATDLYVGQRIKMRRMMVNVSQEKLGDVLGVTFQQIQKYEKGTNRVSASKLQQMANFLDVPTSFFFDGGPSDQATGSTKLSPLAQFADVLATRDGVALCTAFRKLDAKLQRKLVRLTESMVQVKGRRKTA